MQALLENFVHGAELQFRHQPAGQFFGVVAKPALGHAGNAAQGAVQFARRKNAPSAENPR